MSLLPSFTDNINVAIIGASGGIGSAFIENLSSDKKILNLFAFSRKIVASDSSKLIANKIDLDNEDSILESAKKISEKRPLDLVILATGILHINDTLMPEKSLDDISAKTFQYIINTNTIGPALVMKHFLPLLHRERKTVFAALSARVGSISDNQLGGWYAYRASKAALNMLLKTASIEMARRNKKASVIGLHPGTVDTALSAPFKKNVPADKLFQKDYAAEQLLRVVNSVTPSDSGKIFAWDGQVLPY
jgi:NAD(P)-dependent dehydrogenase (short-subunit alcohol dehydrogenase family)